MVLTSFPLLSPVLPYRDWCLVINMWPISDRNVYVRGKQGKLTASYESQGSVNNKGGVDTVRMEQTIHLTLKQRFMFCLCFLFWFLFLCRSWFPRCSAPFLWFSTERSELTVCVCVCVHFLLMLIKTRANTVSASLLFSDFLRFKQFANWLIPKKNPTMCLKKSFIFHFESFQQINGSKFSHSRNTHLHIAFW